MQRCRKSLFTSSLFFWCFYGIVAFWFFDNGRFVDGGWYGTKTGAEQFLDMAYIDGDNLIHEEVPFAEKIALLRFDFVVFAPLLFNGKTHVPSFVVYSNGAFVLPEGVEVGQLVSISAQEMTVGVESFIGNDVEVIDAKGLDENPHEVEDKVLRTVSKEFFGQSSR